MQTRVGRQNRKMPEEKCKNRNGIPSKQVTFVHFVIQTSTFCVFRVAGGYLDSRCAPGRPFQVRRSPSKGDSGPSSANNWSFPILGLHSHALGLHFLKLGLHVQPQKYINLNPWLNTRCHQFGKTHCLCICSTGHVMLLFDNNRRKRA